MARVKRACPPSFAAVRRGNVRGGGVGAEWGNNRLQGRFSRLSVIPLRHSGWRRRRATPRRTIPPVRKRPQSGGVFAPAPTASRKTRPNRSAPMDATRTVLPAPRKSARRTPVRAAHGSPRPLPPPRPHCAPHARSHKAKWRIVGAHRPLSALRAAEKRIQRRTGLSITAIHAYLAVRRGFVKTVRTSSLFGGKRDRAGVCHQRAPRARWCRRLRWGRRRSRTSARHPRLNPSGFCKAESADRRIHGRFRVWLRVLLFLQSRIRLPSELRSVPGLDSGLAPLAKPNPLTAGAASGFGRGFRLNLFFSFVRRASAWMTYLSLLKKFSV